jgi:hypothetical protein
MCKTDGVSDLVSRNVNQIKFPLSGVFAYFPALIAGHGVEGDIGIQQTTVIVWYWASKSQSA